MVPATVSHYRILRKLGAGGMGEVYLAEDAKLARRVAIKFLSSQEPANGRTRKRFIREARAAATLDHPNICAIYDADEEANLSFIVMQYVAGETLAERMRGAPLGLPESLSIAIQIARALATAHAHGIIHRDIKPQNIMITSDGQVKVLDFGLAKIMAASSTNHALEKTQSLPTERGLLVGTVPYMSPEQLRADALDGRSDIFSFGALMYELLTGRQPFASESPVATISAVLTREPPDLKTYAEDVPEGLQRLVRCCLEKSPERRYQSMDQLLDDLQGLQQEIAAGRSVSQERSPRRRIFGRHAVVSLAVILSIILGVVVYLHLPPRQIIPDKLIHSIAVMPFENIGADPDTDYLAEGFTDDLIGHLSQLENMKVIAHNSVFRYKGRAFDIQAVGRELQVESLLVGKVRQRDDLLVVIVELIDARDNRHLWGWQFNRKLADIMTIQEDLTQEITEKLRRRLAADHPAPWSRRETENGQAFQLYLKGRHFCNKRTPADIKKGIEYFEQAIDLDPSYPFAYAGLADAYSLLGTTMLFLPPRESMPKAKMAALQALKFDESLAEAHTSLAIVHLAYDWDWPGAEAEFKRAIALNPNYATAHYWYSFYLRAVGQLELSIEESKQAQVLDPLTPIVSTNIARSYYYARQYDEAIKQCQNVLEVDPNFSVAHYLLGLAYAEKGMAQEAFAEFEKVRSIAGENPIWTSALGYAYAISGQQDEARKVIAELKEQSRQKYVPPIDLATVYIGLGEKDQALEWLEKAYEERSGTIIYLKVEPAYDSLRSDVRFQRLMQRVGL